ncbi:MAG: hypothetical protein LBQ77_02775 [Treponema sp.]|nr:hypothetical protein [Treponema sp.]
MSITILANIYGKKKAHNLYHTYYESVTITAAPFSKAGTQTSNQQGKAVYEDFDIASPTLRIPLYRHTFLRN